MNDVLVGLRDAPNDRPVSAFADILEFNQTGLRITKPPSAQYTTYSYRVPDLCGPRHLVLGTTACLNQLRKPIRSNVVDLEMRVMASVISRPRIQVEEVRLFRKFRRIRNHRR